MNAVSYRYRAKVVRVVDADTFDFDVDLGFYAQVRIRGRLKGIDTYEIRGPERPLGLIAKAYVETLFSRGDMEVVIETTKTGKFGRWLVDVTLPNGTDLATLLLERDHGKPYN